MGPDAIAALLERYGPWGIASLAIAALIWAVFQIQRAHRREVDAGKAFAADLIALNSKLFEAAASMARSMDALSSNIEHRNPLTAVLGETLKAANQAIEHLSDTQERLLRALEDDRREDDRQRGVADATRSDILATLRRLEARSDR